jgi:hypothetical protein
MFLIVNVRVPPGSRSGSPVSPIFAASLTLFPPDDTNAGGSPAYVTGNLSNGTLVFNTTASCTIEPAFFTTNVTSPAGTELGDNVKLIGPADPRESLNVTRTVDSVRGGALVGSFTPPSSVPLAVEVGLLAHAAASTANRHAVTTPLARLKRTLP